jgi:hypothetical protein
MLSSKILKNLYIFLFIFFVSIRIAITWKADVGLSAFDSKSYFNPTLNYPVRMPQLSFIFYILNYFGAISLFQSIFSTISWGSFVISSNLIFRDYRERILLLVFVSLLSISFPIMKFDSIILSESFAINVGLLIIASFILVYYKFNYRNFIIFCGALFIFGFPKQSNIFFATILSLLTASVIIYKIIRNKLNFIFIFPVTIVFILNFFFFYISNQNKFIEQQVTLVNIIERSYDSYDLRKYWLQKDFPAIAYQVYASPPFKTPVQMVNDLPQIKAWKINDYKSPMETFTLTHPFFALLAPIMPQKFIPHYTFYESVFVPLSTGVIELKETNDINLRTQDTKPNYFDSIKSSRYFYWPTSIVGIKILMIVIFLNLILFYYLHRIISTNFKLTLLISIIFTFFCIGTWANWNMALTYTLDRLLTPWSVILKLIFIITLISNLELIRERSKNE